MTEGTLLLRQLAIATTQSCYGSIKDKISPLNVLRVCLPNIPRNLSPRPENGCP